MGQVSRFSARRKSLACTSRMLGVGGGGADLSSDWTSSVDVISSWRITKLFAVSGAARTVVLGPCLSFVGEKGSIFSSISKSSSTDDEVSDRLIGLDCRCVVFGGMTGTGAAAALPLLVGTLVLGRSFIISKSRYVKDGGLGSCAFSKRAASALLLAVGGKIAAHVEEVRSERRISVVTLSKELRTCTAADDVHSGTASQVCCMRRGLVSSRQRRRSPHSSDEFC